MERKATIEIEARWGLVSAGGERVLWDGEGEGDGCGAGGEAGAEAVSGREERAASACPCTKAQLVERIVSENPSATSEYLWGFDVESLWRYYEHLVYAKQPRGRGRWRRDEVEGCVSVHESV